MKKTILSSLLLAVCAFGAQAQVTTSKEFEVSVSQPYEVVDASTKRSFTNGTDVLTVKVGGYKATIQKFTGDNLNCVSVKGDPKLEKGFLFEELLQIDGKVYLFYSVWDKANTTEQLFKREIDFESGDFTGPGEKMFGVSKKITRVVDPMNAVVNNTSMIGGFGGMAIPKFSFQQSNDKSHLVVRYRIKPEIKDDTKNYDVIGMYVYNKSVDEVWHKEFKMPFTESKMDNLDFSVDKEGNGYFLTKVYKGDRPKERDSDKDPNYTIQLFKADGDGELETSEIDVKGHFISGINLFEDPKGYMVCAGYYRKDIKKGVDGVFLAKLKKDGEVETVISHEIPLEVLNTYISKRAQEKNENKED